jgi:SAM-dependent methyltransferase
VGSPSPARVRAALGGVPNRVLVLPARRGRLASDLLDLGADEVLAHEPDPRLLEALERRARDRPGLEVRETPATELGYHRVADAVVADRALYATRSLVGLLGRLHHALRPDGVLVLVDVLADEAGTRSPPSNAAPRSLRVELRARGRDLVSVQDLWRLLIETGFQSVASRRDPPVRRVVRAAP